MIDFFWKLTHHIHHKSTYQWFNEDGIFTFTTNKLSCSSWISCQGSLKSEFSLKFEVCWTYVLEYPQVYPGLCPLENKQTWHAINPHCTDAYVTLQRVPSHILYPLTHLMTIELTCIIFRFYYTIDINVTTTTFTRMFYIQFLWELFIHIHECHHGYECYNNIGHSIISLNCSREGWIT